MTLGKTLFLLTIAVILMCVDHRTNHFHPIITTARIHGMTALPHKGNWADFATLGLLFFLVVACFCWTPFFNNGKRK